MANQTANTSINHDDMTGRLAGEDITITTGATVTIDSMPHLTAMGILGDITISDGTLHIDGRYVREITYSSGTGTIPAVGAAAIWTGGTGKVIQLNSGDNASGIMTITRQTGVDPTGTITSDSWSATVGTVKNGFLIVYGEDQDWGAADARATLKITGEWYEVGVGTGADGQTITLPHTGHQHAVWVETVDGEGAGTGVFEIWHRISSGASTVWYDSFAEFGNTFESGFVFQQTFGSSTLTFGTSTGGGVPPLNARIRIPNVHIGTTTVALPTTEVNSTTLGAHILLVPPSVTCNVLIDHLNASSVLVNFTQTNTTTLVDSAIGLASTFIDRCALPVNISNCCFCCPSVNTVGGIAVGVSLVYTILDMLNGVTITNSVFYGGIDTTAAQSLWLQTSQNISFTGRNKIALAITDENTSHPLRITTSSNITANELICLGGGINANAASNNVEIASYKYGYPPNRGTTEQNQNGLLLVGVDNWIIRGVNLVSGGKWPILGFALLTDCSRVTLQGAGSVTSKLNGATRLTYIASLAGVCSNIKMQRLYFTSMNGTETFLGLNSCKGVLVENCSTDYNDEMEADCNDMLVRGTHVASGVVDAATGFEGDMANVVGTVFYDHFKSDTTGAVGLLFNAPGTTYSPYVATTGSPVFNGLADLLMRSVNDRVVYTWPYWIKGHTGFQNVAIETSVVGTNTYEYLLDTGNGFPDDTNYKLITGANLSGETISPVGFRIKIRITCTVANTSAAIKGLAILTTTTLADQAANLYPLDPGVTTSLIAQTIEGVKVQNAQVLLTASTGGYLPFNVIVTIVNVGTTATVSHTLHGLDSGVKVKIKGASHYQNNGVFTITKIDDNSYSYTLLSTPGSNPTGTITSTFVFLYGLTDVNGEISMARIISSNQPVVGWARKSSGAPYYKTAPVTGVVSSTSGAVFSALMIPDE